MSHYLENYRYGGRLFHLPPMEDTELIVVIPCFNEPDLISSLQALLNCDIPKDISIEVIVVINAGENALEEIKQHNQETFDSAVKWAQENSSSNFKYLIYLNNELPKKHAGVGLARKIGMDEAVDRFEQIENKEGVIVCFDADSKCDKNYLEEIYYSFKENPKATGASIYFEHPTSGNEFNSYIYQGIIKYELFLRYYRQAFKYTGHPQAYHTIGSSMAVKTWAYQKQSGMNKRKAGEDFYFLQKIIQLGNFMELNSTRVIPSPRTSDRVPFGTGRAMLNYLEGEYLGSSHNFQSFKDVKVFINHVFDEYGKEKTFGNDFMEKLPKSIEQFLLENKFDERVEDMLVYGTNKITFSKRFFNWFTAFRVLKFVHFARDNYYKNESLLIACNQLREELQLESRADENSLELLLSFRILDKNKP